jgi:hypothetical protein
MFLIMLGGSLVLGAGLLAAANLSEGMLVAIRTAALCIGWLFLLATVVGLAGLRRADFGRLGAASVTFLAGLALLYVSYFSWETVPDAPTRYAAAELLPEREPVYKAIPASMQIVTPVPAPAPVAEVAPERNRRVATIDAAPAAADACASLKGVESLQCRRGCAEKTGVAWIVCRERARLEYCEGAHAEESLCPSAIPSAGLNLPPG